jgi:flagellar basal-body rod modification protein FlgD
MELDGIYANSAASQFATKGDDSLDRDAFMQLLVTQMQNQDPLEPQGGEQLSAQLAQFSSLEQMEQMNENLTTMVLLQQSNALLSQLSESSALIGKDVTWSDPDLGTSGTGTVESVRLAEGLTFLSIDGQDIPLYSITEVLGEADAAPADTTGDATEDPTDDSTSSDSN